MRNHLLTGGLALLLVAACGAPVATKTSSSSTPCAGASNAHRAYVVVEHQSGATMQSCVGFSGDFIDGQTLMDRSGIHEAHSVSSNQVVCQVDFEPRQFSQCFPANQPYWALFIESGGKWTSAPGGFTQVRLHDKEAIGWHYVGALDPAPSPPPPAGQA
jgi:hypothetical protein